MFLIQYAHFFLIFSRPRIRHIQALPGRPQLQKFTSNSQDSEYETKIEKFQVLLDSPLLDLVALKKLSWSGIPRKVGILKYFGQMKIQ